MGRHSSRSGSHGVPRELWRAADGTVALVNSRDVAETFGKDHDGVSNPTRMDVVSFVALGPFICEAFELAMLQPFLMGALGLASLTVSVRRACALIN
jgi:hypothetical protein